MRVYLKKLPNYDFGFSSLPTYATEGSAGIDIMSTINVTLRPFDRKVVPTGIAIQLPEGYEAQIRGRSGLSSKHGITIVTGIGTVDSDYRGEICVPLINLSDDTFEITKGMKIAQMVICKYTRIEFECVEELSSSDRGVKGFGSTGL